MYSTVGLPGTPVRARARPARVGPIVRQCSAAVASGVWAAATGARATHKMTVEIFMAEKMQPRGGACHRGECCSEETRTRYFPAPMPRHERALRTAGWLLAMALPGGLPGQ